MKNQKAKALLTFSAITAMVLGTGTTAFATVAKTQITANYNNIKIVVDGKELVTDKAPFIYDGTTYLPIRAVGEAVGKVVGWDGATNTVTLDSGAPTFTPSIGTPPAKSGATQITVNYNNIKIVIDGNQLATDKEPFIYEGTTYLPVRAVGEAVNKTVSWDGATNTVTLNSSDVPVTTPSTPVTTPSTPSAPAFQKGTWSGNTFTNSFSQITFTKPSSWVHFTESEITEILNTASEESNIFTSDEQAMFNAAVTYDMIAFDPVTYNNIMVLYENTYLETGTKDLPAEVYILSVISYFVESHPADTYSISDLKDVTIGSIAYKTFSITDLSGGKTYVQSFYVRQVGDYMVVISSNGNSQQAVDAMMTYFK